MSFPSRLRSPSRPRSPSLASTTWALLATLLFAHAASGVEAVHQDRNGVAVEGTDVVAYFADGAATAGKAEYEHRWNGATWRFASAEHRDLFVADPERYAPQYGGYCAFAVAHGSTAGIDPEAWTIVDGKLYLNLSPRIQHRWTADRARFIEQADANWPGLRDG
ncbi:MAG: YHS domain-containing (seleno)protein [Myxococcota bacterium]